MILALLIALVLQGVLWTRERRGRALSQHTSDLVALCNAGGRIRAVSPSCQTVLGYAPAELAQGYHPSRPLPADDVAPWLREARSAAA
jgi:PAS domain-containing protein